MNENLVEEKMYPLTVVADRYYGVYSGGVFTAWNLYPEEIPEAIFGDDISCWDFWRDNEYREKYLVGKGSTVNEALNDLYKKLLKVKDRE